MRALVTGGAGFIGSNLARRLVADGHVKPFAGDMDDYANFVLDRARMATRSPAQTRGAESTQRPAKRRKIAVGA